jgi:hypothetical protein
LRTEIIELKSKVVEISNERDKQRVEFKKLASDSKADQKLQMDQTGQLSHKDKLISELEKEVAHCLSSIEHARLDLATAESQSSFFSIQVADEKLVFLDEIDQVFTIIILFLPFFFTFSPLFLNTPLQSFSSRGSSTRLLSAPSRYYLVIHTFIHFKSSFPFLPLHLFFTFSHLYLNTPLQSSPSSRGS